MALRGSRQILVLLTITLSINLVFAAQPDNWSFVPLKHSVTPGSLPDDKPFMLPEGFGQTTLIDENRLNIFSRTRPAAADWPDMNTVNETGKHAGRYLYRTHEVRPGKNIDDYEGGALSIIDLATGKGHVLAQRRDWEALDGIVWTPWGTLLFAEETGNARLPDPDHPEARRGLLYEAKPDLNHPGKLQWIKVRPALGSMAHEGIEVDAHGNVYVIDEYQHGAIYRFVPDSYGNLEQGQLQALQVSGGKTGKGRWLAVAGDAARIDARSAAAEAGATTYCRPEDIERIGQTIFVALTCEDAVLAIGAGDAPVVRFFVKAGTNVPGESANQSGFRAPDNLAADPGGRLWIVEDNSPSDIWVAWPDADGNGTADRVELFGSLSTPGAEASGIYFGTDPGRMFINTQHSFHGNDRTLIISPERN
ncbi:MAG: PhoX family protein [Gammaproteobacteria bacterium]|nr:PhoX family protein [Gammaproteobacteria bacterium]